MDESIWTEYLLEKRIYRRRFVYTGYTVSEPTYAVGGSIREGDIVDIMETITKDEVKSSKLLVKDAYVLTAWDSSGNVISRDDTTSAAVTFTVYVERSDEEYYNPKNHDNISITKVVQQ